MRTAYKVLAYLLRPEEVAVGGSGWNGLLEAWRLRGTGVSPGADQPARTVILTRLWAKTPCPTQVRAPSVVSIMVRSHP
jgi:hypothetical protein